MRKVCLIGFVLNALCWGCQSPPGTVKTVDVCVYGGTSAGVIAAYTARMAGKSVLLIEPGRHLGGLTSGGLGYTDIGNKYAVTGLALDFYRRMGKRYGTFEQWIFEPHIAEEVFNEYISEGKVPVLYNHRIISAQIRHQRIESIEVENSLAPDDSVRLTIKAKEFIDCSYEGDLMARSGVSYKVGREANSDYNETYDGVELRDKHQFPDGIDPYKTPGHPESGLVWGISSDTLLPQGSGDRRVQTYNFRICLTDDSANRLPIVRPPRYDSTHFELLVRLFQHDPSLRFDQILKPDGMPNHKLDINNNGPFSTDFIGMNYDYPNGAYTDRANYQHALEDYSRAFLYFIGHDPRVPEAVRNEMLKWGYPKDEYSDNDHWTPQIYVREARRMIGAYVMTQHNCVGEQVVNDGIGMAAYTMDSHNAERLVVDGMVKNEGDVQIGGFPPYPISYRALTPKRAQSENLLVPVCLSATHIAYGSIRMEPVFMVLGQSAGLAASMAIDDHSAVQDVDVSLLQRELKDDPLMDGSLPDQVIDDNDSTQVAHSFDWTFERGIPGAYGPTVLKTLKPGKSSFVSYRPEISATGLYRVLLYVVKVPNETTRLNMKVNAEIMSSKTINLDSVMVKGQTSGQWIELGVYHFKEGEDYSFRLMPGQGKGACVADAIQLVKVENKQN